MSHRVVRSRAAARPLLVPFLLVVLWTVACGPPSSSDRPAPGPEAGAEPVSETAGSGGAEGTGRAGPVERIEPPVGRQTERAITPGACHRIEQALGAGELLAFTVEQRGIDVASSVREPEGTLAVEIDGPVGAFGAEEGAFVAERAGVHTLEICAFDSAERPGPYALRIETPAPADGADRARARAHRRYFEARRAAGAGRDREAIALYAEALESWRSTGDRRGQAWALYKLGRLRQHLGELERSAERFAEAARLHRALGEPRRTAVVLSYQGKMLSERGRLREALEVHGLSVRLAREAGAEALEHQSLTNLAGVHHELGETFEALRLYRRLRDLHREAGDRRGEQRVTARMGKLYREVGDLEAAHSVLGESLELARKLDFEGGADREIARALDDLGRLDLDTGKPGSARAHFAEALAIKRRHGDDVGASVSLNNLGRALRHLGELDRAGEALREALDLARSSGRSVYEGSILMNLARVDAARAGPEALECAVGRCLEALDRFRRAGRRSLEARALRCLAEQELARGRPDAARRAAEESLELIEGLRAGTEIADLRATFLADRRSHFGVLIDALMALDREDPDAGWAARAFEVAEQSRARTLLDGLRAAESGAAGAADPETLRQERRLRREISSLERRIVLEEAVRRERGDAASEDLEALERRRRELETERELLAGRLVRRHPGYAGLIERRAAGVGAIRDGLLTEERTRILAYFLGAERSHVWLVGRESLRTAVLPPEEEICARAEAARRLLAESDERHKQVQASLAAAALAEMVVAPVAPLRAEARAQSGEVERLGLVLDGCLHGVPFGALRVSGVEGEKGLRPLLGERFELVELPSASSLLALRALHAGRQPAPRTLAVVADPVLQPSDPRLAGGEAAPAAHREAGPSPGVQRAFDPSRLERLPGARDEARWLRAAVPEEERFLAVGFEASRESVLNGPLGDYRILHFATHGITDPRFPGVLLSRYDRRGAPRDGFLWAREIYGLDLSADLVVLGSCRSGLGPRVAGEGPLGLSRAFLFAGARTVLVSLWDVDDRATSELMVRFYEGLLERDLPAVRALRRAQDSLRRDERFAPPHYWAGFVLQGDWR